MTLLPWLVVVVVVLEVVGAGRWMLIGGYVNVEGQADVSALDSVETLSLDQENQFTDKTRWCFKAGCSNHSKFDVRPQVLLP